MHITLFSFVTAVLLSSLLIVVLYLSRKSVKTIRMLNFGYLACLYLFCLGRIVFSIELPFTVAVNAPSLMNPVFNFCLRGIVDFMGCRSRLFANAILYTLPSGQEGS